MDELKDLLTVNELAELLKLMPDTVRNHIRTGKIKAVKFNGAYIITKEEAERLQAERGKQ